MKIDKLNINGKKESIEVLLFNETKILKFKQAKDLLPLHFSEHRLKRK